MPLLVCVLGGQKVEEEDMRGVGSRGSGPEVTQVESWNSQGQRVLTTRIPDTDFSPLEKHCLPLRSRVCPLPSHAYTPP